jgi:hypothetical protein
MTRVPVVRERPAAALALLAAGWLGGTIGLALVEPRTAVHVSAALDGFSGDRNRIDALSFGGAIARHDGVLIDTDNAPAVVVGRGVARGLVGPFDPAFTLATLFQRIDTPFVAVPDPHGSAGAHDRLNKTFPRLYRDGAPGYQLAYQNSTWRLYARTPQSGR